MRQTRCMTRFTLLWPLTLLLLSAMAGCAPAPLPPAVAAALPVQAEAAVLRGLPVPARLGLVRAGGGRLGPVPAAELARWRGALREVNRQLAAPIRLRPLVPAAAVGGAALADGLARALEAARAAGLDALLVYELSVRVEDDPLLSAAAALPLLGGVVPGTVTTEAQAVGTALLLDVPGGAVLGRTSARLAGARIAPLAVTAGDGAAVADLAEYALLHALVPGAEDMLTEAVAAAY